MAAFPQRLFWAGCGSWNQNSARCLNEAGFLAFTRNFLTSLRSSPRAFGWIGSANGKLNIVFVWTRKGKYMAEHAVAILQRVVLILTARRQLRSWCMTLCDLTRRWSAGIGGMLEARVYVSVDCILKLIQAWSHHSHFWILDWTEFPKNTGVQVPKKKNMITYERFCRRNCFRTRSADPRWIWTLVWPASIGCIVAMLTRLVLTVSDLRVKKKKKKTSLACQLPSNLLQVYVGKQHT